MDYVPHRYFNFFQLGTCFLKVMVLCRPADSALDLGRQSETKFNQIGLFIAFTCCTLKFNN